MSTRCQLVITILIAMLLLAGTAISLTGEEFLPDATVKLEQAREIALNVCSGEIVSQELEKEPSGRLRYWFIIRRHTSRFDFGIDAKTGAVLRNSVNSKNHD